MIGTSPQSREKIVNIVEELFDQIALQFIGNIPKLKNKKRLVISSKPNLGLSNLFVQAMHNKQPNQIESEALKSLLEIAHGYIEGLKSKTISNVVETVDGMIRSAKMEGKKADAREVSNAIVTELNKAKTHIKTIAEAESSKFRNLGTMMDITRVSSSLGDTDPTVFFVVIKDKSTCRECVKLHLMSDGITPRLWKLSELKQGYHKRGEIFPSAYGQHPACRCFLSFLSHGFGFKNGLVSYIKEGYDAYQEQRKIK